MKIFSTAILLCAVCTTPALAHSAHAQITEVEFNPVSQRFEVAMKLDTVALEDSVSVHTGQQFRLESAKHVDVVLATWIPQRFRIQCARSSVRGTVRWIGFEPELHTVWLYFEYVPSADSVAQLRKTTNTIAVPDRAIDPNDVTVENKCLLDVRPDIIHFIQLRDGQTVRQGHCSLLQPRASFPRQRRVFRPGRVHRAQSR